MMDDVEVLEVIDLVSVGGENEDRSDGVLPPNPIPEEPFRFVIEGPPKGWKRPKAFTKLLPGGRYINNVVDTNKKEKSAINASVRKQLEELYGITRYPLFEGSRGLSMEFEFYRKMPEKEFVGSQRGNAMKRHTTNLNVPDMKKPDLDNMVKLLKDGLQGVVYEDDQQVICYKASKMLDIEPPHEGRTVVWVRGFSFKDIPSPEVVEDHKKAYANGGRLLTTC